MVKNNGNQLELTDFSVETEVFRRDVIAGLSADRKTLPSKYLYDKRGSELFDAICEAKDYYPTRTEVGIMRRNAAEMADAIGAGAVVIEYGSGSSMKTPLLLEPLEKPAAYVPVDISREHLVEAAERISARFQDLPIMPVCADFTRPFELPEALDSDAPRMAYFPGSTIGNFTPTQARSLLQNMYDETNGGSALLGVDLKKDVAVLERAYDDSEGVTAEFNINLLEHINRELNADFDLETFEHRAVFNEELSRVEMHLVSRVRQVVTIGGTSFSFDAGETIHTENSHKYTPTSFARLAASAGWKVDRIWTDDRDYFSIQLLVADR
ncbi:MAG TPA: L-histidine N(alpha)-methyltransferase [Phycisphaerae bacterium]|nr:L-histidine N(alpha)-methyltransferase [Phycisphaerae bacterium]HRW52772.1 L-histidine N(alpha)-methyltransferase [Phycisphaerae bacterium]